MLRLCFFQIEHEDGFYWKGNSRTKYITLWETCPWTASQHGASWVISDLLFVCLCWKGLPGLLISACVTSPLGLLIACPTVIPYGLGGGSRRFQSQLVNVQQLSSTKAAFGAIRTDGSVITWGSPRAGGDTWLTEKHVSVVMSNSQKRSWEQ